MIVCAQGLARRFFSRRREARAFSRADAGLLRVERPIAAAPNFSKDFQVFPRKFQGNSKLFQTFPRISKLFPWSFRGKSRGYQSVERESHFLQFLGRLGGGERPGDMRSNALAIEHIANSDYRKEIVDGDLPQGPRGARGGACANARSDRRDRDRRQFGGEAPVWKVWRRLRVAKLGDLYPGPVSPCKPRSRGSSIDFLFPAFCGRATPLSKLAEKRGHSSQDCGDSGSISSERAPFHTPSPLDG